MVKVFFLIYFQRDSETYDVEQALFLEHQLDLFRRLCYVSLHALKHPNFLIVLFLVQRCSNKD